MGNRQGNSGNSVRLYFSGLQITADGDWSHDIKRRLLLGKKVMSNLDSIFKSRDITLPTNPIYVVYKRPPQHKGHIQTESEVAQSCPTLRDPMDCSPPGSSVHGILQARTPEWAFLPRDKHLLISWLQSPSAVIWSPEK